MEFEIYGDTVICTVRATKAEEVGKAFEIFKMFRATLSDVMHDKDDEGHLYYIFEARFSSHVRASLAVTHYQITTGKVVVYGTCDI